MKTFIKTLLKFVHPVFILFIEAYCLSTVCFNPFQLAEDIAVIIILYTGTAVHCHLLYIAKENDMIDCSLTRFLVISDLIVPILFIIFLVAVVNFPTYGMALFTIGIQITIISASLIMLLCINRLRRS